VVVVPPPPPPPAPTYPAPIDTHKFVLSDANEDVVGAVQITIASQSDTLLDIARRFNVGYEEIERANPGVDIWLPGAGRRIIVPTQFVLPAAPRVGIVIDVAALRLYYFPPHRAGEPIVVYTHPIGIGKDGWNTPEGVTKVTARVKDPVWRPSAALRRDHLQDSGEEVPAVVPPGPDNPLGSYEFKLGWPSYLIHGTNKPYGIGLRSSHGCVRLYPEDIEKLYTLVPVGTPVRVVNQPFLFGWHDHQLYLQAYNVLDDDKRDWQHAQKKLLTRMLSQSTRATLQSEALTIDWGRVMGLTAAPRGVPVPVTMAAASEHPAADTATADARQTSPAVADAAGGTGLDAVLAAALVVQNRIPDGANWQGDGEPASADAIDPAVDGPTPAPQSKSTPTVLDAPNQQRGVVRTLGN